MSRASAPAIEARRAERGRAEPEEERIGAAEGGRRTLSVPPEACGQMVSL